MPSLTPVITALDNVDHALVAITRNAAGASGIEHLATSSFQSFPGSLDDAIDFGRRLQNSQLDALIEGTSSPMTSNVLAVLHGDGTVHGSWVMRDGTPYAEALRGADLLDAGTLGAAPTILSHDRSLVGLVADGHWIPLRY